MVLELMAWETSISSDFVVVVQGLFIPMTCYFDNGTSLETHGFQFNQDRLPRTVVFECFREVSSDDPSIMDFIMSFILLTPMGCFLCS